MGTQGMPRMGEGRVKLILGGGICGGGSGDRQIEATIDRTAGEEKECRENRLSGHLKNLLGSFLHARPHLVAEAPQRIELQDRVNSLACLLVVQLSHHHLCHSIRHLDGAQQEHCGCRALDENGSNVRTGCWLQYGGG